MRQLPSLERMQVLRLTAHVDSCAVLANLHVALQSDQVGLRSRCRHAVPFIGRVKVGRPDGACG
jgi:hypothetical protein